MHGTGRTVFAGSRVEEFGVEVLGVLQNIGPKQSIILARLSGGPLEKTGVMQGMSGSPVYIGGKLAGAVALSFTFSKEPIAGIRPIEEMLRAGPSASRPARASLDGAPLLRAAAAPREEVVSGETRLTEIATPVSFGGFTRAAIEHFAPRLRELGLEPAQGMSGGANPSGVMGDPSRLQPGSMITVQLISGDLNAGADGTVTLIDGKTIYAFGHRFIAAGTTDLPFARSEVLTVLPNVQSSFKISAAKEWMGTITQDRATAIAGVLGRRASLVPVSIALNTREKADSSSYHIELVNDPVLSPLLLQMAVFSAVDATERALGEASYRVRGRAEFQSGQSIRLDNIYVGDANTAVNVSLGVAIPVSYALQSGFDALKLKNIALDIDASERKDQVQIGQVWTSSREVRPGDSVELGVELDGLNGRELSRTVRYTVPIGSPLGPLYFTVADGATTNLSEFAQTIGVPSRSAREVVGLLNGLRDNDKAYVRVWRADADYQVDGVDFPDPPPSLALLLARSQAAGGNVFWHGSKLAEMEIAAGGALVSGSRTVQVEVKQ